MHILVTGAGSVIGAGAAHELAKAGHHTSRDLLPFRQTQRSTRALPSRWTDPA